MARKLRIQYAGAVYHAAAGGRPAGSLGAAPGRRGWCLREEAFRKEVLAQVSEQRGAHHYGAELQEGEAQKAERLVTEELARRKWSEAELGQRPKTDRQKARMARRLRRETTMTLAWIARRLQMGSVNTVQNTLRFTNSRD